MNLDISDILSEWPYEPGKVSARMVRAKDARELIQLRLDLGVLQMETTGRPDGKRPHGHESLLDYHEHKLDLHRQTNGSNEGFILKKRACELLRSEAVMYYHRYLAEFVLEQYEAVERDTMRNLRLMDFCNAYAKEQFDRYLLDQYRPYVIMMCTRSRMQIALRDSRPRVAVKAVEQGVKSIEKFYERFGLAEHRKGSKEINILRAAGKQIEQKIPPDPDQRLRDDLAQALQEERYEDAALLRDRLRGLGNPPFDAPRQG